MRHVPARCDAGAVRPNAGHPGKAPMLHVWNTIRETACVDGPACLGIRALLAVLGVAVLTLAVYSLPSIAVTPGEIAVGIALSLPVAAALLYAAAFPRDLHRT